MKMSITERQPFLTKHFAKLIRENKLVHAYLLSGAEGTGKIELAKWIAKGIFCLNSQNGVPCLKCSECNRIENNNHPDVVLANASNAIIIGFNVIPSAITKEVAKEYNVDIRLYTIIYKVIEEMELAMKGLLDPEFEENILGNAEIRKIFTFSKIGKIAGCYVADGIMKSGANARVIRDGVIVYDGRIASVQREKDSVKEVKKGFECGITLENFSDIKEGDIIENYEMVEIKR